MRHEEDQMRDLAVRARQGDTPAAQELRERLERHVPRIARRILRLGRGPSALARIIRDEADRLSDGRLDPMPADRERLISQIAGRLCDVVLGGLVSAHAKHCGAKETVEA